MSSSLAFVSQFFTEQHARGRDVDAAVLTEAFLMQQCRRHHLHTTDQLLFFLLSARADILREATATATAASTAGAAVVPLPPPQRKRPRADDCWLDGSYFAPDATYGALIEALCRSFLPVPRGDASVAAVFPTLREWAAAGGAAEDRSSSSSSLFYSTGYAALDAALGGGFRGGWVTELSGEAGTGKTLVALQTLLTTSARKAAALVLCEFFTRGLGAVDAVLEACEAELLPFVAGLHGREPAVVAALAASCGSVDRDDAAGVVRRRLARMRSRAAPVCCVYLVSEDVPAARLSTLAAGAVRATYHEVAGFLAPLLPSSVYEALCGAMRLDVTVERVLEGLRVRPFATLQDLADLLRPPTSSPSGGTSSGGGLLANLLSMIHTPPRRAAAATEGAAPLSSCGGVVVLDSIAAAAVLSAAGSDSSSPPATTAAGQRALLDVVGARLRGVAAAWHVAVVVTNQVRSRVRRPTPSGGGVAAVTADPLLRLRAFHGFETGSRRRRTGTGTGAAAAEDDDDAQVPALGLQWGRHPHCRAFLRKASPLATTTAAAAREFVLTASPAVAPFVVDFVITGDGMRPPVL